MTGNRKVLGGVLIGAGALLALGSLLPWATVSLGFLNASVNGTAGDGKLTLILALPVIALGIVLVRQEVARAWSIVGGVVLAAAFAICAYDMSNLPTPPRVGSGAFQISIDIQIGIGLWLCLIGSISGCVAIGLLLFAKAPASGPTGVTREAIGD